MRWFLVVFEFSYYSKLRNRVIDSLYYLFINYFFNLITASSAVSTFFPSPNNIYSIVWKPLVSPSVVTIVYVSPSQAFKLDSIAACEVTGQESVFPSVAAPNEGEVVTMYASDDSQGARTAFQATLAAVTLAGVVSFFNAEIAVFNLPAFAPNLI